MDLELRGTRPKPLVAAAMATIDQHRALLYGRDVKTETHSLLMNLIKSKGKPFLFNKKNSVRQYFKTWTIIDFNLKPSPRSRHTIFQLVTQGLEDESICLLVGGLMVDKTNCDHVYVLDCDNSKAYQVVIERYFHK